MRTRIHVAVCFAVACAAAVFLYGHTLSFDWSLVDEPLAIAQSLPANPVLNQLRETRVGKSCAEQYRAGFLETPVPVLLTKATVRLFGAKPLPHRIAHFIILLLHIALVMGIVFVASRSAAAAVFASFAYLFFSPDIPYSTAGNWYSAIASEPWSAMLLFAWFAAAWRGLDSRMGNECGSATHFGGNPSRGTLGSDSNPPEADSHSKAPPAQRLTWFALSGILALVLAFSQSATIAYVPAAAFLACLFRKNVRRADRAIVLGAFAGSVFSFLLWSAVANRQIFVIVLHPRWHINFGAAVDLLRLTARVHGGLLLLAPIAIGFHLFAARRTPQLARPTLRIELMLTVLFACHLLRVLFARSLAGFHFLVPGILLALLYGISVGRLLTVLKASTGSATLRLIHRDAKLLLVVAALLLSVFCFNGWLCLNNFRSDFRCNETTRVRACNVARSLLTPGARLLVAVSKERLASYAVQLRLKVLDHIDNEVVELLRSNDLPSHGDVVLYHPMFARVSLAGKWLDTYTVHESGKVFVFTSWSRLFHCIVEHRNPLLAAPFESEFQVLKVK